MLIRKLNHLGGIADRACERLIDKGRNAGFQERFDPREMCRTADRQHEHRVDPTDEFFGLTNDLDAEVLQFGEKAGDAFGAHVRPTGATGDDARTVYELVAIQPSVIQTPSEFDAVRRVEIDDAEAIHARESCLVGNGESAAREAGIRFRAAREAVGSETR